MKNKDIIKGALALGVIFIALVYFGKPFDPVTNDIDTTEPIACTMDAKQCPDGSYVGRVAPFCEFAECPALDSDISEKNMMTDITVIKYTKYGFSPEKITVKKGSTVGFQNASNAEFWPKSDIFDAEKAIAPGNKFIFTFDNAGTWTFYNNLNSEDKGTIVVK